MRITIYHLYPDMMNLYGDYGNLLSIIKRCEWRGIKAEVAKVKIGEVMSFDDADIIFMGGGQDRNQLLVSKDLVARGPTIREAIEKDVVALTICGGYQLFGKYFTISEGTEIPGIGVFDSWTIASKTRMIGNILVNCQQTLNQWPNGQQSRAFEKIQGELVGFENHSGKTFLGESGKPLGQVVKGFGNDGLSGLEGCRYRQAFGSYLHGPLLPKNPWFTDYLIMSALKHRYGDLQGLSKLDDTLEIDAHVSATSKAHNSRVQHI